VFIMSKFVWNEENVGVVVSIVGAVGKVAITKAQVDRVATQLGVSTRSVSSKLRNMGYEVERKTDAKPRFSPEETKALSDYVTKNAGKFTAAEVAEKLFKNKFNDKEVRGRLLSLKLSSSLKPAPVKVYTSEFTAEQTSTILRMTQSGAFLEEIATTLSLPVNKVRGKALSMLKKGEIAQLPKQQNHVEAKNKDALANINVPSLTLEEIAAQVGKTVSSVKAMLTRRGISAKDYDGAKRAAKIAAKREAESQAA
jgi:hypothetical protein